MTGDTAAAEPAALGAGVRVAVIGAGAWGTALACLLAEAGHRVRLWCRDPQLADTLRRDRVNARYLPRAVLPRSIAVDATPQPLGEAEVLVVAVPVQGLRATLERLAPHLRADALMVTASKGLERGSLCRVSQVLSGVLGTARDVVALSGPSFAAEVIEGEPTAVTAAGRPAAAERVQRLFASPRFRVYTSEDVIGVELGGALKNVIAIACGIVEGLGLGRNAQAALITRGLAEMTRLGVALGARQETFLGLSGVGDLVLTCSGELSRNRRVGVALGQGQTLSSILAATRGVAEGIETSVSVLELAQRAGVEMPVSREVRSILFDERSARDAVMALMTRDLKAEA